MNGNKIADGCINNVKIAQNTDFRNDVSNDRRVVRQSTSDFPRASEALVIGDPRGTNLNVPLFQIETTRVLDNLEYYDLKPLKEVCKYLFGLFDSSQPIVSIQEFWSKTIVAIYNSDLTHNECEQSMIDLVILRNLTCRLFLVQFPRSISIETLLSLALKLPKELRLKIEAIILSGLKSDIFISLLHFPNLVYTEVDKVKSPISQMDSRISPFIIMGQNENLCFKPRFCETQRIPLETISSSDTNLIPSLQLSFSDMNSLLDMNLTPFLSRCIQEYRGISSQEPLRLNLDPGKKKTISEALFELLNKAEFLFVAQVHNTFDGKIIVDNLPSLKKNGLTHIALEIPSCQQNALEHFIATGDDSLLASPYNRLVKGIEYKELIQKSKDLELKIIAFDDAITPVLNPIAREINMAKNLFSLVASPGKKLIMAGGAHVRLSESPYPSARCLMDKISHKNISAISLQSLSGIKSLIKDGLASDIAISVFEAYAYVANHYNSWLDNESFAFPASGLGNLAHRNAHKLSFLELVPYAKNYDYVFFLNENDSNTTS